MKKRPLIIITRGYPVNAEELSFLPPELMVLEKYFDITLVPKYSGEKCKQYLSDRYRVVECNYQPVPGKLLVYALLTILDKRFWKELLYTFKIKKFTGAVCKDIVTEMMLSKNLDTVLKPLLSEYEAEDKPILYSYWFDYSLLSATSTYASKKGAKAVTRAHGFDLYHERCKSGRQVYKEQMDKKLAIVLFISEFGKRYYLEHFAHSNVDKYFLAYIGTKRQNYITYTEQKVFHIVSCSYMVPLKRIDIIIQALNKISELRIHWTHIGEGPTRTAMECMAEEYLGQKSNITYEFKGYMENEKILEFYREQNIGCYILISDTEGLPFSIMEAMSFGIPTIANDVGGIREIVREDNGILLSEINPDLLADAIKKLAGMEKRTREILRRNAYEDWADNFDGLQNAEKLVKELNTI